MEERCLILLDEIKQITEQYKVEVPGRRRAWPKSVKDRMMELHSTGVNFYQIAKLTGISYPTILSWRARESKAPEFRELTIAEKEPSKTKSKTTTVTVSKKRKYTRSQTLLSITVGELAISGLEITGVIKILKELGVSYGT